MRNFRTISSRFSVLCCFYHNFLFVLKKGEKTLNKERKEYIKNKGKYGNLTVLLYLECLYQIKVKWPLPGKKRGV